MKTGVQHKSRAAQRVAGILREKICSGRFVQGDLLPPVRDLSVEHGVCSGTVSRAVRHLEEEGLLVAEPRRGYRVLPRTVNPMESGPLAFVFSDVCTVGSGQDNAFAQHLLVQFQRVAADQGWPVVMVSAQGRTAAGVFAQLIAARARGAIISMGTIDKELLAVLAGAGIPAVLIDEFPVDIEVNTVFQDGCRGGILAAEQLAGEGCKRIGWIGPEVRGTDYQIADRLGGALGGLARQGLDLLEELRLEIPLGKPREAEELVAEYLARRGRPDGILALWQDATVALAAAATRLGIALGDDLRAVGWCTDEDLAAGFAEQRLGSARFALVTWSVRELVMTAAARLDQCRLAPHLPTAHTRIGTRLRTCEEIK